MSPKDKKKGAQGRDPSPPPAAPKPPPPATASTTASATASTTGPSPSVEPAATSKIRPTNVEWTVGGLMLLPLAQTCIVSPLLSPGRAWLDPWLTVPLGLLISSLSFWTVSREMLAISAAARPSDGRRYELGSLLVSLAMFYVVGIATALTILLFGIGALPVSGSELALELAGGVTGGEAGDATRVDPRAREALAESLFFSAALAFVGACFYIANRMRQRGKDPNAEPFDPVRFWGGLWFRLGQANLYIFALFIYVWATTDPAPSADGLAELPFGFRALPLIGLFVGMFVRAGEALVLGLAERLFQVAERLVGPQKRERPDDDAT